MSDLIGLWRLDKGSGLIAFDTSGYGNDGDLEGPNPTWSDGISGKCVSLPGNNERVNCGNNAPLDEIGNGDFSISFWMKSKDTVPLLYGGLFSKIISNDSIRIDSVATTNQLRVHLSKGASSATINFNAAPFDTSWHHIVMIMNRTTNKALIYLDSQKDAIELDVSGLPADISNAAPLAWGASYVGANCYEGLIDECRVYDQVLTQDEIDFLFNNPNGVPRGKMTPWLVSSRLAGSPDSMAAKVLPPSIVAVAKEAGKPTVEKIDRPLVPSIGDIKGPF